MAAAFPDPEHPELREAVGELVCRAAYRLESLHPLDQSRSELLRQLQPCLHLVPDDDHVVRRLNGMLETLVRVWELRPPKAGHLEAALRAAQRLLALAPGYPRQVQGVVASLVDATARLDAAAWQLSASLEFAIRACERMIDAVPDDSAKARFLEKLVDFHTGGIVKARTVGTLMSDLYKEAHLLCGKAIALGVRTQAPARLFDCAKACLAHARQVGWAGELDCVAARVPDVPGRRELLEAMGAFSLENFAPAHLRLTVAAASQLADMGDTHFALEAAQRRAQDYVTRPSKTREVMAEMCLTRLCLLGLLPDDRPAKQELLKELSQQLADVSAPRWWTWSDLPFFEEASRLGLEPATNLRCLIKIACEPLPVHPNMPDLVPGVLDRVAALSYQLDPTGSVARELELPYPANLQVRRSVLEKEWQPEHLKEAAAVIFHVTGLLWPLSSESSAFRGPQPQASDLPRLRNLLADWRERMRNAPGASAV